MKGKFKNDLAERLYNASLDGTCETVGDVQYGTHYSRVEDWCDPFSTDENCHEFDGDYILAEDTSGFVTISGPYETVEMGTDGYYNPSDEAWNACLAEWEAFYSDEDDEG